MPRSLRSSMVKVPVSSEPHNDGNEDLEPHNDGNADLGPRNDGIQDLGLCNDGFQDLLGLELETGKKTEHAPSAVEPVISIDAGLLSVVFDADDNAGKKPEADAGKLEVENPGGRFLLPDADGDAGKRAPADIADEHTDLKAGKQAWADIDDDPNTWTIVGNAGNGNAAGNAERSDVDVSKKQKSNKIPSAVTEC